MTDHYGPRSSDGPSYGYGPSSGRGSADPGVSAPYGYGSGGVTDRYTRPTPAQPPVGGAEPGGGMDGYVDPTAFGKPPVAWLAAAAVVAVAAAVAALALGAAIEIAFGAWLAAGPVAIGLLAVYAHRDTLQRARAVYDGRPAASLTYWVTAAVASVGILAAAWRIAQWAGRL